MSTKLNKKQFIEALRKLIRKEIEEASTTASAGGNQGQGIHYDTPKAFASGSDEEKGHPTDGEVGGYTKAEQVNEVMFAVKISKDGSELQTIVGASSKGQAKTKVARMLKGGMKDIIGVSRIQPAFGKQIDNYDIVIRCNHGPTEGYESHVGSKTNVRVVSSKVFGYPG